MSRIVIFIVVAAILVAGFRLPFAQDMLESTRQFSIDWLSSMGNFSENHALDELKASTHSLSATLRPFQQEYLSSLLQSKEQVSEFYTNYCEGTDKNPFITGASKTFLCNEIQKSSLIASDVQR